MLKVSLPEGKWAQLGIKLVVGFVAALWWTSGPGSEEASDVKAKVEKRNQYGRHFALKGRGRKESLRTEVEDDRSELVPTKAGMT